MINLFEMMLLRLCALVVVNCLVIIKSDDDGNGHGRIILGRQLPQLELTVPHFGRKTFTTARQEIETKLLNAWDQFKSVYNKHYATKEKEELRREIFIENMKKIQRFNMDYANGVTTFVQKLNPFADMLHHEFHNTLNGWNRTISNDTATTKCLLCRGSSFIPSANVQIPSGVDWRKLGAVTPVRSQGKCAGCYAFSAAGALEGHYYRKTGILPILSPQNLIDCTKQEYENSGCLGGLMEPAFQYVKDNMGIDTEFSYPYEESDNVCRFNVEGIGAVNTGFVSIPDGDEEALRVAVATIGPVSAAIDASHDSFQFYSDGVYFEPQCKNETESMNHAILIVGYDTEPNGKEYWLVKNSYGPEWGNGGYIKMARNADNHCGIANIASYPLV